MAEKATPGDAPPESLPLVPKATDDAVIDCDHPGEEESAENLAEQMAQEKNLGVTFWSFCRVAGMRLPLTTRLQKLAFTLGVANMGVSLVLWSRFQMAFLYFYSAKMFVLFGLRFYLYYQSKSHYFMCVCDSATLRWFLSLCVHLLSGLTSATLATSFSLHSCGAYLTVLRVRTGHSLLCGA